MGVLSNNRSGEFVFTSIHGQEITIYGKGKFDSVSIATQGIAQDIVTIILGIPLLLISLYLFNKNYLKGKLLIFYTHMLLIPFYQCIILYL